MLLPGDEEQLDAFKDEYLDHRPIEPRGTLRSILVRAFAIFFGIAFITTTVFSYFYIKINLSDIGDDRLAEIIDWEPQDNSQVFDHKGTLIAEFYSQDQIFTPYAEIPRVLIDAIIAVEDRQFWQHQGIDLRGILRAVWVNLSSGKSGYAQGGSTITQQLVRHFLLAREKTISRKLKEIFLAYRLETALTKRKILEIYVNSLFLGNGAYGVASAAKRYFNKPLAQLKTHELAVIAGLFQSPSRYNPEQYPDRARARQKQVLRAMAEADYLTEDQYAHWQKQKLVFSRYKNTNQQTAPYFIDYVYENARHLLNLSSVKNAGLRIYTTLDRDLQKIAETSVRQTFEEQKLAQQNAKTRLEAALLSINPTNGEILAMVGGRDYRISQYNRCSQARRQPGSLFKPIVYSYALMHGYRWSDVIFVSPVTIDGRYRPRSISNDYMKETTLLRAFFKSMNSPTMELGQKFGVAPILRYARHLGIHSPIRNEFGSLLGSSDATMLDLARVYGSIGSLGVKIEPTAILRIEDRNGKELYQRNRVKAERVMPAQIAYLTLEGMRQVLLRGTGSKYPHLGKWAAGKTGTSNDSTDNWFAGFGPKILAIAWVGPDQAIAQPGWMQGSTVALPIWARYMEKAAQIYPQDEFVRPSTVVSAMIDPIYGRVSTTDGIEMWFLKDNPPQEKSGVFKISPQEKYRDPFF